MHMWIRDGTTQ